MFPMQCALMGTGSDRKKWYAVNPKSLFPPGLEMKSFISLAFEETAFNAASCKLEKLVGLISDVKWIVCKVMVSPLVFGCWVRASIIALRAGRQTENAVVEIDLQQTDFYRTHWPFMRDRRIDSYQPITKRFIDEEK